MSQLTIDPEFEVAIPPLSQEEYSQLEQNILADGCRDAFVGWRETDTLLDGHNRRRICDEHGLDYPPCVYVSLPSREAALDWIDANQLGRRNAPPNQVSILRGRRYNRTKKAHGGDRKSSGQNVHLDGETTAESLAAQYGVDERTIRRDGQFAAAVEKLGIEKQAFADEIPVSRDRVIEVANNLPDEPGDMDIAAAVSLLFDTKTAAEHIVASNENEWYTPARYIDAARAVLGEIDLDPASCDLANKTVQANSILTIGDDSLQLPWAGRVWLNPPYGRLAGAFTERLVLEYEAGKVTSAIVLLNAHCTDTAWFQPLWDYVLCFTDHRIDFDSAGREKKTSSTHGSVFVYLGPDVEEFKSAFSEFGAVVRRA